MKILVTGMTSRMIGSQRLKRDYVTFAQILADALRTLGHEVEHRALQEYEDLSSFDLCLVGICHLSSQGAGHLVECSQALKSGVTCALYVDDWTCVNIGYSFKHQLTSRWEKFITWKCLKQEYEAIELEAMRDTLLEIVSETCSWPMIAPMFQWGDHLKLWQGNVNAPLFTYDPSAMIPKVKVKLQPKVNRWVLATLNDHDAWVRKLNLQWPVFNCGNARKAEGVLPEAEVVQKYAESWGVLSPLYPKSGCGWWRVRFNYAAAVGSILLCDSTEAPGAPYQLTPAMVEGQSDRRLKELANEQRLFLEDNTWPRDRFLAELGEDVKTKFKVHHSWPKPSPYDPKKNGWNRDWETDNVPDDDDAILEAM